jgi:iron complex outermembrane receptor protein
MYGNSAFFAVINVITRQGRQVRGGEVGASLGSFGDVQGQATFGTVTRGGLDVIASVTGSDLDGRWLAFPEMAGEVGGGVADRLDGEEARNVFARAAWRGWSLSAAHVRRHKGIPTGAYETVFGDPRNRTTDYETVASGGYDGALGSRARGTLRLQYGDAGYDGTYVYRPGPNGLYEDTTRGRWWGVDWNVSSTGTGRHTFTFGGELVDHLRQDQAAWDGGEVALDFPSRSRRWGAYVQDEVRLGPVLASLGVRHDRYGSFGGHTSPRLGLILWPAGPTTVKALFGTAFRAPNAYELHYYSETDLQPETIRTAEVIVERSFGPNVHLRASAFANHIDDLIALYSPEEGELAFRNAGAFRSRGIEAAVEARRRGAALRASYSFQTTIERGTGVEITNSPRHLAKLSVSAPFASRFSGAADAQYMSSRHTLSGAHTPSFLRVDVHLTARALRSRLEGGLTVRNVFDAAYADPGSEEHRQDVLPQDGRTVSLSLKWRF